MSPHPTTRHRPWSTALKPLKSALSTRIDLHAESLRTLFCFFPYLTLQNYPIDPIPATRRICLVPSRSHQNPRSLSVGVDMAVLDFLVTPWTLVALGILYYVLPYFTSYKELKDIPSPFGASFTNLWLLAQCRQGKRYLAVDEAHKKLGPLVRIQPDHVSVADADAINTIYGHGNGFLKR
jgi:hypothetical protein